MNEERIEWTGTPSQAQNLLLFIACVLVIPIPWALWRWILTRTTVYTLTDQRLKCSRGILTKVTDDLELYRVRDTKLQQTLWQRMLGCGDVILFTSDASTPEMQLRWLPDAEALRERIRRLVEARRDAKHVRTFEDGHVH